MPDGYTLREMYPDHRKYRRALEWEHMNGRDPFPGDGDWDIEVQFRPLSRLTVMTECGDYSTSVDKNRVLIYA